MKLKMWWIASTTLVIIVFMLLSFAFFKGSFLKASDVTFISGNEDSQLDTPMAIVSDGQRVFVANGNKNEITVFDRKGDFQYSIGKSGINSGEFQYPVDLLLHANGNLFVADFNNQRIQAMEKDGKFLFSFGQDLGIKPTAIAADKRGFIYVSDVQTHTIKVFSDKGKFLFEFGGYGEEPGLLKFANGIAVSSDGDEIYVSDSQNSRIQVYSKDGEFIKVLKAERKLGLPKGIAVSGQQLYVSDTLLHKVFIMNLDGKTHKVVGEKEELLKFPNDVFVDDNYLFVADRSANRIVRIPREE